MDFLTGNMDEQEAGEEEMDKVTMVKLLPNKWPLNRNRTHLLFLLLLLPWKYANVLLPHTDKELLNCDTPPHPYSLS